MARSDLNLDNGHIYIVRLIEKRKGHKKRYEYNIQPKKIYLLPEHLYQRLPIVLYLVPNILIKR